MSVQKPLLISVIAGVFLLIFVFVVKGNLAVEKKDDETELNIKSSMMDITNAERSYKDLLDFPYHDGIEFVDEDVFQTIKTAYERIDFFAEFEKGDIDSYDFYKEKYLQLIMNEVSFKDREITQPLFFKDLDEIEINSSNGMTEDSYSYIFFDMDGDDMPELCVTDETRFRYIFKYISATDEFILWCKLEVTWYGLIGTQKIYWNRGGDSHVFYKKNKDGSDEYTVYFFKKGITNRETEESERIYMVSLPQYIDKEFQVEVSDKMINQGYYDQNLKIYYFRVSEQQYFRLVADYFVSYELSQKNIKEVKYSFDELFNDRDQ